MKTKKSKQPVQLVQVSDSHPWTDGVMYVGKDGKLHPLIKSNKDMIKCCCCSK